MCISKNQLRDGSLVACRKCWQCRQNRIDTWVGRCIAESKTSVATTSLTLTYGRDENGNESHARAAILTYSDVQKYFKQLRNRGYPCRYLITGEHGSEKGRAHWHGIVFWQKHVPQTMMDYGANSWHRAEREVPLEVPIVWGERFNEPCWVHGFSHWEPVRAGHEKGSIAYACKYINKDVGDPLAQSKLAMSKNPPIGSAYFIRRAQEFVDNRVAPQDGFYQFPLDAKRKSDGKPVTFRLAGKVEEIFCQAFLDKWAEQVGGHPPESPYIDAYLDGQLRDGSTEYEYVGRQRYIRHPANEVKGSDQWQGEMTEEQETAERERQVSRLRVENSVLPKPVLTPYGRQLALDRLPAVWLDLRLCGRWSRSKVGQTQVRPTWMQSVMHPPGRNVPR